MKVKKILLMDDDVAVNKSTSQLIEIMGHEVVSCFSGEEAIKISKIAYQEGHPFEIIILDIYVPNGLGAVECVDELRKISPESKIIITSGDPNSEYAINYKKYGFDHYLPKPFTFENLKILLNQ
jgi:DNA-binding NtrC family response regulator